MLEGIMIGLTAAFSIQNLLMVIAGCLIGTFIGMLPGLGPMSIIAIMIPVAISLGDPTAALILLAGVYYGAILLMIFAPALSSVALLFHSAEYFALMVVGLSAIAAFASDTLLKIVSNSITNFSGSTSGNSMFKRIASRC